MKKALSLLMCLLFILPAAYSDELEDFSGIDRVWDGQKSITNQEFEDAINSLEAKKKQKEEKQKKKRIKKISGGGTSLHPDLAPTNEIPLQEQLTKNEAGMLLNIPVNIILGENVLEKGFYNVFGEKDKDNNIYLSFYQSQYFKGKVRAFETNDDYDSEHINFVELLPYDKNYVKIIFGSLDFNAYAYIQYK